HDDLARLAVDAEIGEHHLLHGREVPAVAGRRLIVPGELGRVGVDRDDGRQVQVVAAARAALVAVPGAAVARADIEQIGFGIVGKGIPGRAAASARLPPLAGPRRGGLRHGFVLEAERRVAGYEVEPPDLLPRLRVVRRHVAARTVVAAAVADDDEVLDDARRARDRV